MRILLVLLIGLTGCVGIRTYRKDMNEIYHRGKREAFGKVKQWLASEMTREEVFFLINAEQDKEFIRSSYWLVVQ